MIMQQIPVSIKCVGVAANIIHAPVEPGVWIAIEYSYKLGLKTNLNFCTNMAGFCRNSHKC